MIELLNCDCMEYMATVHDKYFDLAIVDPPYGIGVNVSMGRRKGQEKSGYHKFAGGDIAPPKRHILLNCKELAKIKLYGVQTILLAKCHLIAVVGLCGTKDLARN